jgi:hypothetical protein
LWEICGKFKSPVILTAFKVLGLERLGHAVRMDGERSERRELEGKLGGRGKKEKRLDECKWII